MDIEVELALEVVAAELAKVCFVPDDDRGMPDAVEACPAREQRVDDGRDMLEVLLYELALRGDGQRSSGSRGKQNTYYGRRRRRWRATRTSTTQRHFGGPHLGVDILALVVVLVRAIHVGRERRAACRRTGDPPPGLFLIHAAVQGQVLFAVRRGGPGCVVVGGGRGCVGVLDLFKV